MPFVPIGNVARRDFVNCVRRAIQVDAYVGADLMAHRIHRVVRLVAMHRPVARVVGDELDRAHLADRAIDRNLRPPCLWIDPATICSGDMETRSMNVDRMVGHGEIAVSNP